MSLKEFKLPSLKEKHNATNEELKAETEKLKKDTKKAKVAKTKKQK